MSKVGDVKPQKVLIKLSDGVEREIRFDLNALAELEERYGSVEKAFKQLEENQSIKALRCVLWAGLQHEENPLSEKQVGSMIDISNLQELTGNMNKALSNDLPEPDENKSKDMHDPNA